MIWSLLTNVAFFTSQLWSSKWLIISQEAKLALQSLQGSTLSMTNLVLLSQASILMIILNTRMKCLYFSLTGHPRIEVAPFDVFP